MPSVTCGTVLLHHSYPPTVYTWCSVCSTSHPHCLFLCFFEVEEWRTQILAYFCVCGFILFQVVQHFLFFLFLEVSSFLCWSTALVLGVSVFFEVLLSKHIGGVFVTSTVTVSAESSEFTAAWSVSASALNWGESDWQYDIGDLSESIPNENSIIVII